MSMKESISSRLEGFLIAGLVFAVLGFAASGGAGFDIGAGIGLFSSLLGLIPQGFFMLLVLLLPVLWLVGGMHATDERKELAEAHGFKLGTDFVRGPIMTGDYKNRGFEINWHTNPGGRPAGKLYFTVLSVSTSRKDFKAQAYGGFAVIISEPVIETGNPAFDKAFKVASSNEPMAERVFDSDIQSLLLKLKEEHGKRTIDISKGVVSVTLKGEVYDWEVLEPVLSCLVKIAEKVEVS